MDEYEYYDDSMRLDEMNTAEDYNRFEEEQVWADISAGEGREFETEQFEEEEEELRKQMEAEQDERAHGEMIDQLHDQMMEDRIGGTGYCDDEIGY